MSGLMKTYLDFTGAQEMESKQFVKLFRDTKLLDGKYTQTDADLIFTKVKSKGAKRITFEQFNLALGFVAEKKGCALDALIERLASAEGPILTGTVADNVRFHDDKSTYTGVHQHGGPTTIDAGRSNYTDLSQFADRSNANVRGVKGLREGEGDAKASPPTQGRKVVAGKVEAADKGKKTWETENPELDACIQEFFLIFDLNGNGHISVDEYIKVSGKLALEVPQLQSDYKQFDSIDVNKNGIIEYSEWHSYFKDVLLRDPAAAKKLCAAATKISGMKERGEINFEDGSASLGALHSAFLAFSGGQSELDGRSFVKLLKETKVIEKDFSTTDADLTFAKVKSGPAARKITFTEFENALILIAEKKKVSEDAIRQKIETTQGPTYNATKAEYTKFHDDKSTYTGVYAQGGPEAVAKGQGYVPGAGPLQQKLLRDRTTGS